MKKELAIIKDINVGLRDCNRPICWFTVELMDGCSLQIITISEMEQLIKDSGCYKLTDLNNKPCIVQVDNGTIKFDKIKG